jgi:hypothetical protein
MSQHFTGEAFPGVETVAVGAVFLKDAVWLGTSARGGDRLRVLGYNHLPLLWLRGSVGFRHKPHVDEGSSWLSSFLQVCTSADRIERLSKLLSSYRTSSPLWSRFI